MKKDDEIFELMDKAEQEIKLILKKYNLDLGMLYDDGVAITLRHEQHANGDISVRERESFN